MTRRGLGDSGAPFPLDPTGRRRDGTLVAFLLLPPASAFGSAVGESGDQLPSSTLGPPTGSSTAPFSFRISPPLLATGFRATGCRDKRPPGRPDPATPTGLRPAPGPRAAGSAGTRSDSVLKFSLNRPFIALVSNFDLLSFVLTYTHTAQLSSSSP